MNAILDNSNVSDGSDSVPFVSVDYRVFAVNTVFYRAFTYTYLPTGVSWIDRTLENEGFRRSFKDNMRRMLNTGEYYAMLGVKNGKITVGRIPTEWVRKASVFEKTGALLVLVYVEPVVVEPTDPKIAWKRTTWTPSVVKIEISLDSNPNEEESYKLIRSELNPYGFIPVVVFKLGSADRGVPIWWPVKSQIDQIEMIINDIRICNAYNASPIKYVKTESDFKGIGQYGFVQLGATDDIGVVQWDMGTSLFDELAYAVGVFSDILGIPITSILQVGKHASGESIEKRLDSLTKIAKSIRDYVGEQMRLMFMMMCAFISQGLVEVDLNDPSIQPLITDQVIIPEFTEEQAEDAKNLYIANKGNPIDLAFFIDFIPNVKWVPMDKINPQDLTYLASGLGSLLELKLINDNEARKILELNIEQIVVASDMSFMDTQEAAAESFGKGLNMAPMNGDISQL